MIILHLYCEEIQPSKTVRSLVVEVAKKPVGLLLHYSNPFAYIVDTTILFCAKTKTKNFTSSLAKIAFAEIGAILLQSRFQKPFLIYML